MPVEVYYSKGSSKPERYAIHWELRNKLSILKTSTNVHEIWSIFQKYCCDRHLFYQNYDTGIFLPDKILMDLLEIPPTTRISADNIMKILKSHLTLITDKNLGLILDEEYRHMATIAAPAPSHRPPTKGFKTSIGHKFICGIRTQKKKYPNNFVLLKKIRVSQSNECHYIHSLYS